MPSAASAERAQQPPAWESTPETESAPGLAEAALDAFLSAHVEYLGNRQYRCVLDGKVLSKFSIMRVHVAKKFGGLVHQWAVDQRVVDRRSTAPVASASTTIQEHGSPVRNVAPLPSFSPSKLGASPSIGSAEKPPLSARSQALKRVEELEEELVRLRSLMDGHGGSPNNARPNTRPAPIQVDTDEDGEPRSATPIKLHVAHPVGSGLGSAGAAIPVAASPVGSPARGSGPIPPPPGYPPHYLPYGGAGYPGSAGYWPPPPPMPYFPYYGVAEYYGGYPTSMAPGSAPMSAYAGGNRGDSVKSSTGGKVDVGNGTYASEDGVGAPGPAAEAAEIGADDDDGYSHTGAANTGKLFGMAERNRHGHEGGGGNHYYSYPRGANFADMLASERGPNPFAPYRQGEAFGAVNASTGFTGGSGAGSPGGGSPVPIGPAASQRLARYTSPTRRAESQLAELMGGAKVDRLGLFMSARSQQLARRKFLCEIDGKVFSTMNLMRIHFERNYREDADTWWRQQLHMDPTAGGAVAGY